MSEFDFDEQLDRVLQRRAEAEVPLSLEKRIQAMLMRKRMRIAREMWWTVAIAACLLLGVFLWSRLHAPALFTPQTVARTPPSLVHAKNDAAHADVPVVAPLHLRSRQTSYLARRAKLDANAGTRQSETTASAYAPLDVGIAFHMPPATLRIAEHTATCALTPCSCPEMCRASN